MVTLAGAAFEESSPSWSPSVYRRIRSGRMTAIRRLPTPKPLSKCPTNRTDQHPIAPAALLLSARSLRTIGQFRRRRKIKPQRRRASRSASAGPAISRINPWPMIPNRTYAPEIATSAQILARRSPTPGTSPCTRRSRSGQNCDDAHNHRQTAPAKRAGDTPRDEKGILAQGHADPQQRKEM